MCGDDDWFLDVDELQHKDKYSFNLLNIWSFNGYSLAFVLRGCEKMEVHKFGFNFSLYK